LVRSRQKGSLIVDAREFSLYKPRISGLPPKDMAYGPFKYLSVLMPIAVFGAYWSGEALHRLELQWVREHPGQAHTLADACALTSAAPCDVVSKVSLTYWLALGLLICAQCFLSLMLSLPKWPAAVCRRILMRADALTGIGLALTLAMVIVRGIVAAMSVWLICTVWWNNETLGVQLAAVIGVVALTRLPPHMKMAWLLYARFSRRRTGREVWRAECPALWQLIDEQCRRLQIASPQHLVLGVFPDCRAEVGKMTLDPEEKIIGGSILYVGATLANSLTEEQLRLLIGHALLRMRGGYGNWLPAAEDWLEAKDAWLQDCKSRRAMRELGAAVEPALYFCDEWLTLLKRMLPAFQAEHAYAQKADMQHEAERQAPAAAALLADAQLAYRKDVFHLFIVNLTSGVECPAVFMWFAKAFAQRHAGQAYKDASCYTERALNDELVLLEKEWLIKTAQASTPTDCWELRAA
jgi:hypothetical protein